MPDQSIIEIEEIRRGLFRMAVDAADSAYSANLAPITLYLVTI